MRVAFSAIAVHEGAAGIGRYAANVAESLIRHGDGLELVLMARDDGPWAQPDLPSHVTLVRCRPTGPMWEQLHVPGVLESHGVDVYHSPLFMLPIVKSCRQVCTIHDVIPERFPEQTPPDFLALHERYAGPCLRAADAVLTVSDYSKRDMEEMLPLDGRPVHVAYQAISEQFSLGPAQAASEAVRRKLGLPDRFILYVGSIEPRKNGFRLVDAFDLVARRLVDVDLVFAGRQLFADYDVQAYAEGKGLGERVRHAGYVADEDLPGLYSAASLLAFPSSYEGFGLPVTEAMACGCPVVSADNSSLPEAGGDAALYVDPEDVGAFADAMLLLLEDEAEREARIERGLQHAAQFTRERFAGRLVEVYRSVLEAD